MLETLPNMVHEMGGCRTNCVVPPVPNQGCQLREELGHPIDDVDVVLLVSVCVVVKSNSFSRCS
jgi:hypothetical protein